MTKTAKPNDVFFSYAAVDEATASSVRRELEKAGLVVFPGESGPGGDSLSNAVRIGIQGSTAFVALITPTHLRSDNLALEVGAAWVWSTPIYLLLSGVQPADLPTYLRNYPAFPIQGGITKLVEAVRRQAESLTDEHRRILAAVYQEMGIPVDRLISEPGANAELASRFVSRSKRRLDPARLVRELLRLRKGGNLPRLTA